MESSAWDPYHVPLSKKCCCHMSPIQSEPAAPSAQLSGTWHHLIVRCIVDVRGESVPDSLEHTPPHCPLIGG